MMRSQQVGSERTGAQTLQWFLLLLLVGCGSGTDMDEAPPNRPRTLNKPGWASPESLINTAAVVDAPNAAATPQPTPTPEALGGIVAKIVEKYRLTERTIERERSVQTALPDMTEKDVTEAVKAISLGRRLEAEVGMALITGYYTNLKDWLKIEDAYKQLFQSVPELRFSPKHLVEHAWTLMKMGQFQKSIDRANEAERFFTNLAPGESTILHRARVMECRAWSYEGLFRDAVAKSNDDDTTLYRKRAVKEWEDFRDLLKPLVDTSKDIADRVAVAEDHIAGFKSRE